MTTKKNTAAAPAVEPSTDDLLRNLNDKRAEDLRDLEAAEDVNTKGTGGEPDADGKVTVTLPEGSLKVIFLRGDQVVENDHRASTQGAKMVPEFLVWERQPDGGRRAFHAYAYAGNAIPRIYKGNAHPCSDWIPHRVPGTAGTSPAHFMIPGLQAYFESTGPVTITVDREALVDTLQTGPVSVATPRDDAFAFTIPNFVSAELTKAVETVITTVTSLSEGPTRDRARIAAEHLRYLLTSLAVVDRGACVPRPGSGSSVFGLIGPMVFQTADLCAAVALILKTLQAKSSSQEAQNGGHQLIELARDLHSLNA